MVLNRCFFRANRKLYKICFLLSHDSRNHLNLIEILIIYRKIRDLIYFDLLVTSIILIRNYENYHVKSEARGAYGVFIKNLAMEKIKNRRIKESKKFINSALKFMVHKSQFFPWNVRGFGWPLEKNFRNLSLFVP